MIFRKSPKGFNPKFEVVSCFCEYNGNILLLKRQREKPQGETWGVPAGKIDFNEKPKEAAIREIREETGISVNKVDISFFDKVYVKYSDLDFVYYIFHTKFKSRPKVKIKDEEHEEYIWTPPQKALGIGLIENLDACIKLYYKVK